MEALLAFGAALLALRLAGRLLGRWRERPRAAARRVGRRPRRVRGRLGRAGLGSGLRLERSAVPGLLPVRRACSPPRCSASARSSSPAAAGRRPLGLVYTGLAVGVAIAVPLTTPVTGDSIPERPGAPRLLARAAAGRPRQQPRDDRGRSPSPCSRSGAGPVGNALDRGRRGRRRGRQRAGRARRRRDGRVHRRGRRAPLRSASSVQAFAGPVDNAGGTV